MEGGSEWLGIGSELALNWQVIRMFWGEFGVASDSVFSGFGGDNYTRNKFPGPIGEKKQAFLTKFGWLGMARNWLGLGLRNFVFCHCLKESDVFEQKL